MVPGKGADLAGMTVGTRSAWRNDGDMTLATRDDDWYMPDAIRGFASILVAIGHAYQVFLYPLQGENIWLRIVGGLATWSVAAFFLLSGILIATSIKRRSTHTRFSFRHYIVARALRIWPPLLAAVVITVLTVAIIRGFNLYGAESYHLPGDLAAARDAATFNWSSVATTLTLTYQLWPGHEFMFFDGPLWSLSFEWWLYVLAGLGAAAVLNRSILALAGVACLAWLMFFHSTASHPPFWAVSAVWGAGFAVGWNWTAVRRFKPSHVVIAIALFIAAAMVVAGSELFVFVIAPYNGTQQHAFYVLFSLALLGAMVLLLAVPPSPRSIAVKILRYAGAFSYTLYLVHFPLFLLSLSLFRPLILKWGFWGHGFLAMASFVVVLLISDHLARVVENRRLLTKLASGAVGRILPA